MIQRLEQIVIVNGAGRTTKLVLVKDGDIYACAGVNGPLSLASGGDDALDPAEYPQSCVSQGYVYFTEGASVPVKVDLTASAVATDLTATAGDVPENCRLCCIWRDRLVLARPTGEGDNPALYFMSKIGTHTNWDYAEQTADGAFAGNNSTAGGFGDFIVALMPASDDYLYFGCDHSIWKMSGDPRNGGTVVNVSGTVGVVGPDAWCRDGGGSVYFVAMTGLHRLDAATGAIENLTSGRLDAFFKPARLSRTDNIVTLEYDPDRQLVWALLTPIVEGPAIHLVYDLRNDAFWPVQFPRTHGPICVTHFDGDEPVDRVMLLGGRSGYYLKLDDDAATDDGVTISSLCYLGPTRAVSDLDEGKMLDAEIVLGEAPDGFTAADFSLDYSVQVGSSSLLAVTNPRETFDAVCTTDGRQPIPGVRLAGSEFVVKLSSTANGKIWSLDSFKARFAGAGRER